MKRLLISSVFALCLSSNSFAGEAGPSFESLTLDQAAELVEKFFAGKTRLRPDGTVIYSGHPRKSRRCL
jgi:hypothetical protein